MGKPVLDKTIIDKIVALRKNGHSLPEIRKITNKGNATVYKYCKDVEVLPEYQEELRSKQGGSKRKAGIEWGAAKDFAADSLLKSGKEQRLVILACLYWAEGRKADFDLINSDPELIRVFAECLKDLGVPKEDFRISIRVYADLDKEKAIDFWIKTLHIKKSQVVSVNTIAGKKEGKLKYGMCRLRIVKGGRYFKQIMSLIERIKDVI